MSAEPRTNDSAIDYTKLVTRWIAEVWNNRKEHVVDEMMSPGCLVQLEGVDGELTRGEFKKYRSAFRNAMPDLFVEILSITTEGNISMWTWRATGTHLGHGLGIPPSGKRVDLTGATYCEFQAN